MTDLPRNDAGDDAARVREVLGGASAPDASILAAVQDGLMSVPAGSPSSWFDVPSQRQRPQTITTPRRQI